MQYRFLNIPNIASGTGLKSVFRWKRCIVLLMSLFLFTNIFVWAQDIHHSQFYTTPLFNNPGNTGNSGENSRVALNYRNQWSKIGVPYKTFYASVDQAVAISGQTFGIGGYVVHDKSTTYGLTTNELMLSLSYSKYINNHQFTIGLQPGFGFKSYDLSALTFGSQFDNATSQYSSSLSSSESGLATSVNYFDLNVGFFWRTLIRNIMPSAGISFQHVLRPVVSFSSSQTTRQSIRINFSSQVIVPVGNQYDVVPSINYSYLPGTSELLLGTTEGYYLPNQNLSVKKIYAINLCRINPFTDVDAVILGGGLKFTKFDLGVSYDFNVSSLAKLSQLNGAFEISLIYTGGKNKKKLNEPCIIY
jgi:type IX secretion system PorP/SprF family membrane protein